jgi:hypothetical protein
MSGFKKPGGESYRDRWDRFSREGAPSPEESLRIQHEISQVMSDVINRDARHNVHDRPNPYLKEEKLPAKSPASAGERPLTQPPGIEIIDRLCDAMLPHGPESKAREKPKGE